MRGSTNTWQNGSEMHHLTENRYQHFAVGEAGIRAFHCGRVERVGQHQRRPSLEGGPTEALVIVEEETLLEGLQLHHVTRGSRHPKGGVGQHPGQQETCDPIRRAFAGARTSPVHFGGSLTRS